jgi:signal transduction histidine kinase
MGGRGLGLGPYTCVALARLHGGRIDVTSTEGEGAAFDRIVLFG